MKVNPIHHYSPSSKGPAVFRKYFMKSHPSSLVALPPVSQALPCLFGTPHPASTWFGHAKSGLPFLETVQSQKACHE